MKKSVMVIALIGGIIAYVYRSWFLHAEIIGGDWPYYYEDFLSSLSLYPIIWQPWLNNGLGGVQPLLGLSLFGSSLIVPFVNWFHIPWTIVYKVGWFGFFLALSFFSPVFLWRSVFPRISSRWPGLLAGLIYSTNSYILMVTGGGQMGVALAYSIAPFVLVGFIKLYESVYTLFSVVIPAKVGIQSGSPIGSGMTKSAIIAGLALGFQLMIDPRIAYVTMVGVGTYTVISFVRYFVDREKDLLRLLYSTFFGLSFSVGIAGLLNSFWILPMVVMKNNPLESLGSAYTSIDSIRFYSFADFSHALSLLHPNWPENLFGKVYFLQPEFLVLPLLAFSALAWMGRRTESREQIADSREQIVFFALLALVGAFMAKGAQEPFGSVYEWMFVHVPGFVMFRDPTKWYVLVALGYSMLVPFALEGIVDWLSRRTKSREQRADSK